jgi:hypothetical protein
MLTEDYLLFMDKLDRSELNISVVGDLPRSIFGGMALIIEEGRKPCICISPYFMEIYRDFPSLTYAVLFHEIQHACEFFRNGKWFKLAISNRLENYLYEMDALYAEAMFIRDISKNNGMKLSRYEQLVLDSLAKDNLHAISVIFSGYDMNLTYQMVKLEKNMKMKYPEKIRIIEDYGTEIVKTATAIKSMKKPDRFELMVTMYTYHTFVPQILFNIESTANTSLKVSDFSIEKYGAVQKCMDSMAGLIRDNGDFMKDSMSMAREYYGQLE